MAAACEMESIPEKYLTLEEKTKLKERLALLKKEYKKTVHRLQRSQRAERVKTHIKKTIEEQNRLLSQELSAQHSVSVLSGPFTDVNNVAGKVTESTQSMAAPPAEERKPSVSFNLDPEILPGERRSLSYSGSESSGQDSSKTEASGSPGPNHGKRSRLRLHRSARSESVSPRFPVTISPEGQCIPMGPGSTRGPTLCLRDNGPLKISETTVNSSSENTRRVQVSPERKNDLGVNVSVQQRITMEDTNASASPVFKKCPKADSPSTRTFFPENVDPICPEEKETQDVSCRNKTMQRVKDPPHSGANNTPPMGAGTGQDQTLDVTGDPSPRSQVVETSLTSPPCADDHSTTTSLNHHGGSPPAEEIRSPLDSCTLVEGLLFPVEYYVRTTRRMTSCQRKVDLEAVINSQLGCTARKGTRGGPRRADASSTASPKVSGTPPVSATRSRRGRKSCPASVSSGLINLSKELETGSDTKPEGDGTKGESEEDVRQETSAENPKMEEGVKKAEAVTEGRMVTVTQDGDGCGSDDVTPHTETRVYNLRTPAKTRQTGSPSPLFGGRLGLLHILGHSNITDFHLPDEDFGLLKLKKLKSFSFVDPFVPELTKQKQWADNIASSVTPACASCVTPACASCVTPACASSVTPACASSVTPACASSVTPACASSALLHGPPRICTSESPKVATPNKLNHSFLHSRQATLRDNVPASQDVGPVSQTFFSRETPEVFHLSKETGEAFTPGSPVTQVPCDLPPQSALWAPTCSNTQVSDPVLQAHFGSLDPEAATFGQGVVFSSVNMEPTEDKNFCSETEPPLNVHGPGRETRDVVLSTSMCSGPADTHSESIFLGCTPGLPMLGFTPAAFSSPAPSEEMSSPRTTAFTPPEQSSPLSNGDDSVAQDGADSHRFCNLSFPTSGDDARGCHPEDEESANRSDQCTEEGTTGGDRLCLVSEIKDACGGGLPVDLCSVWWDFSGCTDLCVVSASEYSVRLWRPQEVCTWKCVHTWDFPEISVIQILPMFQERNLVCVAVGNVEITEIWVLASDPDLLTWEKQLVKHGLTKTAQGLSRHRVVTTSGEGASQVVELWQLSENGSVAGSHTLVAPKDSIVAFSEVDGERDALVGSTVDNNLVLWNSVSGHLLGTYYIGDLCSDIACISATSDSGLLFFVIGSVLSKPCEINGSCVFKLIATNPQGGASARIMAYTLPDGASSRFLEGDVKKPRAAAVLTCGSIALWDLSRSHCSALLPPDWGTPWCLVRWGHRSSCLLAGRKDGSICVYEYTDCG
ncbi:partner and localizer of BRCA2 isoform 2-T2 [Anomaloglossus baeobatrachus]|uniref:partner and localizer of BRCA2 isoform X2 n=1 Tax=Anomaloglossus baeobatrachus TaxID=238106 RepID=UPI003F505C97